MRDPGLRAVTIRVGKGVPSAFALGFVRGRGLYAVTVTGGFWAVAAR